MRPPNASGRFPISRLTDRVGRDGPAAEIVGDRRLVIRHHGIDLNRFWSVHLRFAVNVLAKVDAARVEMWKEFFEASELLQR